MRPYEVMVIFDPETDERSVQPTLEQYLTVITLTAEPADVKEMDRQFRINESIMRTKVIRPDTR